MDEMLIVSLAVYVTGSLVSAASNDGTVKMYEISSGQVS